MMANSPICFNVAPLADFLLWAVENHAPPSKLIICRERSEFLAALEKSLSYVEGRASAVAPLAETGNGAEEVYTEKRPHRLRSRTLRVIAASSTLDIAYCPSVPVLHAYLSTLPAAPAEKTTHKFYSGSTGTRMLGLVDAMSLHRRTGPLSAQSLGRAFAAGVEAADRCRARLVVFESAGLDLPIDKSDNDAAATATTADIDAGGVGDEDQDGSGTIETVDPRPLNNLNTAEEPGAAEPDTNLREDEHEHIDTSLEDPWELEVPVVNQSTKTFGMSRDKSWMTRKVKAGAIVGRWCHFHTLPRT